MEPRVDNVKYATHFIVVEVRMLTSLCRLKKYCEEVGFYKEGEVSFPHKQSSLLKIKRENWEQPFI